MIGYVTLGANNLDAARDLEGNKLCALRMGPA